MAEQTAEQEPTMEEILASIRRIISEDEEPAEPPPQPRAESKSRRGREAEEAIAPPARVKEPEPVYEEVELEEPEFMRTDLSALDEDGLVSEPVANAAAVAFGELVGQMLVSSRSTEGKTLEDIVREMMKPMIRQWLDANLRSIVEATVASEVRKIAARARGR
jgi:cell pole-organizing protein PopZ